MTTETVPTNELKVGDTIDLHGVLIRLDGVSEFPSTVRPGETVRRFATTIVSTPSYPTRFAEMAAERCREGTLVQGNSYAMWQRVLRGPQIGHCTCGSVLSAVTGDCVRGKHCVEA